MYISSVAVLTDLKATERENTPPGHRLIVSYRSNEKR